jgi:hypothetical protein
VAAPGVVVPVFHVESTFTPGALISTAAPKLLNRALEPFLSVAATVMTPSHPAGV